METTVVGEGEVSFRCKLSTASDDELDVLVDGTYRWGRVSGSWYEASPISRGNLGTVY